ncbi:MAG: signal peptide peptidase SppA [Myxococcaceae bacterium]
MRLLLSALWNLITLVFVLLGLPFRALRSRKRPPYVQFRLKGDPPYRPARGLLTSLSGKGRRDRGQVRSMNGLALELRALAQDPAVRGVVFLVDALTVTAGKREVLIGLIRELRHAGKEVVVHALAASNTEYQLMCAANRVLLTPGGRLELIGFSAEATALAAALKRVGVRAEFVRRGDYKTAPELFTLAEVSDIQRKTIEGFLDEQFARLVRAIAQGRQLTEDEVKTVIDSGPYSAPRALKTKLCDGLCPEADLPSLLNGSPVKEEDDRTVLSPFDAYNAQRLWPVRRWRHGRRRPRVAVVSLEGMIVPGEGGRLPVGPRTVGADGVVRALRAAGRDSRAKAVVLYVASPGGSSLASEQIFEAVERLSRKKPVVAYFDRVAASGGYLAAMGAREVWTEPSAVTGSIGVFAGKFDLSGLMERIGIAQTVITRGANAALTSSARGLSTQERAALEAEVEETYQSFLGHVAKARKMTVDDVHRLAEGRVYSGEHAKQKGLVDQVGGFEDACRRALELTGKKVGAYDLATYQRGGTPATMGSLLRAAAGAQLYSLELFNWSGSGFTLLHSAASADLLKLFTVRHERVDPWS